MARKQALAELIAKVEAGGEDTPDFSDMVARPIMQCKAGEAYRGSIDAAKALHEAVLPGQDWSISPSKSYAGNGFKGESKDPARAWLLAILKALHSMEKD